jgi:outer membrane immunogenic protein
MASGRLFIVALLSFGFVASSQAADLGPLPAEPVSPALSPYNWTGFYVGLNGGYGWGRFGTSANSITTSGSLVGIAAGTFDPPQTFRGADRSVNGNGWLGGGQIGYNYQIGTWVLGVEGDYQAAGLKGTDRFLGSAQGPIYNTTAKVESFGTIRARAGYAFDDLLIFATAGLAVGEAKAETSVQGGVPGPGNDNPVFSGSDTQTLVGWTIGAGAEYAIAHSNWSVKAEYLYADFGDKKFVVGFPGTDGDVARSTGDVTASILRLGVNYRF